MWNKVTRGAREKGTKKKKMKRVVEICGWAVKPRYDLPQCFHSAGFLFPLLACFDLRDTC